MNFCKRSYQPILRYLYTETIKRRGEISLHKHFNEPISGCFLRISCDSLLTNDDKSVASCQQTCFKLIVKTCYPQAFNAKFVIDKFLATYRQLASKVDSGVFSCVLYGVYSMICEIFNHQTVLYFLFSTKIFQVEIENVGPLTKIRMRQDVSAVSPNWRIEKV